MSNKGKILWCIWAGILVLLFLMSSTDLIIKEKEIEVYPVSVIIDGDNDDYYVNLKKGHGTGGGGVPRGRQLHHPLRRP